MKSRLQHIADDLGEDLIDRLSFASHDQLRFVAASMSKFAVTYVGLNEPRLQSALETLADGRFGDSAIRAALEGLVEELDSAGFNARDEFEAGRGPWEEYSRAFARARAANAVWFALDADPAAAAAEAIYEAHAAVDDPSQMRAVLAAALSDYNA